MHPNAWKIMPVTFFDVCWQFGKISILQNLPKSDQSSKKVTGMIFHAFGCIYFNFFDFQNFDQNLTKFDQILIKFWPQKCFPSNPKWVFPRLIDSQSLNFLSRSVQKLFSLVRSEFKGQFLCDLAAFKVTNWRKDAQTHEVWAQSISFHLSPSILKSCGPYPSSQDTQ